MSVKTLEFESESQMNTFLEKLGNIQSHFDNELREMLFRIERCENLGAENTKELKLLDKKFNTELTKYHSKQEDKIPYIFDAPDRNQYFSGRIRELQDLQRNLLNLDDTGLERKACVAAVCGLGGVGKTSLVTEYAHRMKKHYEGGVYWFSAEDDTFFEQSVNDAALKLGALLGTFNLTLTKTLIRIGQTSKPYLIVLDCLDQLDLSPNILKFLSLVSRQSVSAAVVVMTRRSECKLVDEISNLHKDRCLSLRCLEDEETKQFLFYRTGLTRDDNTNSVAESLVNELGGLPLALEQAGACIKALRCDLSEYLEQFQTERLKLLESQKAKPVSVYEKPERLAVHTTWLLNIKHIKESLHGMSAILLMNAFAFLNPSEIEKELVNVGESSIEDKSFRDCISSPLGCRQVVKLLTDFSLFTYVHAHSVSTHRLVQELVRENLDPEEKAKSFVDAVRLLSFAFSKCTSPKHLLGNDGMEERLKAYNSPRNHSQYYLWSKLCFHGFQLQRNMEKLLANPDPECLDSLFVFETVKLLYECVVYLSANQKQEEAKRTLNFAYRMLDWIPEQEYDTIQKSLSSNSFFPSHVIPLPKWLQIVIKKCCVPPMSSLEPLDQKPTESPDLEQDIDKLRSEGNRNFNNGLYKEALDAYSAAIDMSRGTTVFNALLLTNRASAYIKLHQLDDALRDANEYISRFPDCWKGYARKALALDEKVCAEIAAALASYYFSIKNSKCIFSEYKPFQGAFPGLKQRISICHTVDQLLAALDSYTAHDCLRVIILGSKEYIINLNMSVLSLNPREANIGVAISVRDCIMLGSRANASVYLKLEGNTGMQLLGKCMLQNLSFAVDKGQIIGRDVSFVKMLSCNFTSNNTVSAAVGSIGKFNAERCNFTNCKAGGLLCVGPGNMVVDNCTFAGNMKAGLEVRENGKLKVRNSRMYNNSTDGLVIGPKAAKCDAFDCQIYHNAREGITVQDSLKCVALMRNHVFGNDSGGIFVKNSDVDMRENKFFDNEGWGIWSQTNSWCNVSMNEVFRNKCGGIRVGKRKKFPPSVVELNTVHDNFGPAIVDTINNFEDERVSGTDTHVSGTNGDYISAKYDGNVEYNNEERVISNQSKFSSSWCSGCKRKCEDLKKCGKCFTAGYCNKDCEKEHCSKHKNLCKVLREKSSFLITSMTRRGSDGQINTHARGLDDVGPDYSDPPPRNGKKFVAKVQTYFERRLYQPHSLIIYDRSLDVDEVFQDEFIEHLVKDFGVLCERRYQEKKLFLHCMFEKNGKLRLFINDFADFQKW
ncbi:Stress-induced-phospho 1 [Paramuricea clavata]|uniref:Stress-induced-phospho 1 n=1 Tax=Paramuricea clavata TaxID=317549 RepID=A0A7D9J4L7_PARCT|nr:Stress-induced-phospho 1 [Paramuricea clavata]